MRDLTDAPADEVAAERARVAREGADARLLALQGADGRWGDGARGAGARRAAHGHTALSRQRRVGEPIPAWPLSMAFGLRTYGTIQGAPGSRRMLHLRFRASSGSARPFDQELIPCDFGRWHKELKRQMYSTWLTPQGLAQSKPRNRAAEIRCSAQEDHGLARPQCGLPASPTISFSTRPGIPFQGGLGTDPEQTWWLRRHEVDMLVRRSSPWDCSSSLL